MITLCACTKTVPTAPSLIFKIEKSRPNVTLADVYSYIENNNTHPNTKSSDVRIQPIVSKNDTVMYLVNYQNGWELLSGVRKASKILMKSDSGRISYEDLKSNPDASEFMMKLEKSLSSAMHDNSFRGSELFNDTWDGNRSWPGGGGPAHLDSLYTAVLVDSSLVNDETRSVGPLLATHWGQDSLWNCCMPYMDSTLTRHCYCGCVPVAAGQVLYYLNQRFNTYPAVYAGAICNAYIPSNAIGINIYPSDVTFYGLSSSNWSNMAHYAWNSSGFEEVSALLLDLGIRFSATYTRDGTGAALFATTIIFPNYGYTCEYTSIYNNDFSELIDICESDIYDESLPLIMGIGSPDGGGHAVVIDGYKYSQDHYLYQYNYYDDLGNYVTTGWRFGPLQESRFVTINWGWSGRYDSTQMTTIWYNLNADWIVSNYNYSIKRRIVHNFAVDAP